ncbi:MAG: AI-2E family transporter, partial [Acidimicrobiia bacterium]|nr:AI-2E family transporter [Acidimicrobiia bacterium]
MVGIAVAATIIVWIIGAMAGLVIPLVVAVVTGMLLHPVVDRLERIRCPRSAGAALVLIGLSTVVVASLWLTVVGVIDQGDEISARVTSGLEFLDQEIGARWDPIGDPETAQRSLADAIPQFLGGLSSWFGTVFSSIAAFLVGTGISAFFLYYILRDWYPLNGWMEQHLGVDPDLGSAFVADANNAIRSYFGAIT